MSAEMLTYAVLGALNSKSRLCGRLAWVPAKDKLQVVFAI